MTNLSTNIRYLDQHCILRLQLAQPLAQTGGRVISRQVEALLQTDGHAM